MATKRRRSGGRIHRVRIYANSHMHAFTGEHPVQDERDPMYDGDARQRFREVAIELAEDAVIETGNQAIGFRPVTASEIDRLKRGLLVWRDEHQGAEAG